MAAFRELLLNAMEGRGFDADDHPVTAGADRAR